MTSLVTTERSYSYAFFKNSDTRWSYCISLDAFNKWVVEAMNSDVTVLLGRFGSWLEARQTVIEHDSKQQCLKIRRCLLLT